MRRLAPVLLAAILLGSAAQAADSDTTPYGMMRTLQALQEQVAHGNTTAQGAQVALMAHIADNFRQADPVVWKDGRNARAAILFLLSGGRPEVVRDVLDKASFPIDLDRLLKGALAYGDGQDEAARVLLDTIDPQSLPSGLGAHLALVKANLAADQDPEKAIKLLDSARLLAPGTLIEEAALRREVFLLIDKAQLNKAMLLSRQYLRRFRASTYADNFRQRFVAAAVRMAVAGDTIQLGQLDAVLTELPPGEIRLFYLTIARTALLEGKMPGAQFAARKADALAQKASADEIRAKLYLAASSVVTEDPSAPLFTLASLDEKLLSKEDLALRAAAMALGNAIRAEMSGKASSEPDLHTTDPMQASLDHGRTALDDSARLLATAQP